MKPDICEYPGKINKGEVVKNLGSLEDTFKRYNIRAAYLFGSTLYEDEDRLKDLDIGILHDGTKDSFELYVDVYYELCKIFKADNIDVAILNDTTTIFKYEVVSKGEIIYSTPNANDILNNFIEGAIFDYYDTKAFQDENWRELVLAIKEGTFMTGRKIDRKRIGLYFENIRMAERKIREKLKGITSLEDFVSDENQDKRDICIHYLRITLESILDACRHIIAVKGFRISDFNGTQQIDLLGENGVIPYEFARKIRGMVGMRNAIVHVYWDLSYEKIYMMITANIGDFEVFAKYIIEYMEKE